MLGSALRARGGLGRYRGDTGEIQGRSILYGTPSTRRPERPALSTPSPGRCLVGRPASGGPPGGQQSPSWRTPSCSCWAPAARLADPRPSRRCRRCRRPPPHPAVASGARLPAEPSRAPAEAGTCRAADAAVLSVTQASTCASSSSRPTSTSLSRASRSRWCATPTRYGLGVA